MTSSPETKECPLFGENMRRKDMEFVDYIPGTSEPKRRRVSEWVCPECENFEEIEDEGRT